MQPTDYHGALVDAERLGSMSSFGEGPVGDIPTALSLADIIEDDDETHYATRTHTVGAKNLGDAPHPDHPPCMLMRDWTVELIEPTTKSRTRKHGH